MTEPLLGVILATSSSRGSHIVFRWPNNPKLFKRYSKVRYYTAGRSQQSKSHFDDDLDPVRQKAKWDRHDEDDHENEESESEGQSDTTSSSDPQDSDLSAADDDDYRSNRDTIVSHGRSRTSGNATARSKSKSRWPLSGLEEAMTASSSKAKEATHDKSPDSDTGASHQHLSPEEKARREERAAKAYKTYLGYDVDILASILNPRQELAHQKFELVVDDLAFLGHPVCVGKDGTWGRIGAEKGDCTSPPALPYRVDDSTGSDTTSAESSAAPKRRAPLTQFHLVLVLDRPDPTTALSGMDLSSWLQLFYDNIVFKMTAALFAEQVRAEYVGLETEKLLALRERCMDDGQAYSAYAAQCLGISSLARCLRDLHKSISTSSDAFLTINDRMEVHVQLPPILQDPANLIKVSDIETELDPNDPVFLSGGGFAGLGKEGANEAGAGGNYERLLNLSPHELTFEEWTRTTGPYLLPWKTLLLLHDQTDDAPQDSTADVGTHGVESPASRAHGFEHLSRKFSALFRPSLHNVLNFSEVADLLGWDLYEDVYPMVRHLIYYRQARVIDVPRPGHVYGVSPLFDFANLPHLSRAWRSAFPDLPPLAAFLSHLSSSLRPLTALFPGRQQKQMALDVLIWLLRNDVVVKIHVRLRLIATEDVKRKTAQRRLEQHERHRLKKEKRQRRIARAEAKLMKRSQAEEGKRRKAAAAAAAAANTVSNNSDGIAATSPVERRGRSRERDRDRSRSANATVSPQAPTPESTASIEATVSQLGVSRPAVLQDTGKQTAADAASAEVVEDPASAQPHHHHHHHHHHNHHRHHHQKDLDGVTNLHRKASHPSLEASVPINAPKAPLDELTFERRPVLRSRSPSTTHTSHPGISFSFSNADKPAIFQRSRAGTIGSGSSSGTGPRSKDNRTVTQRSSRPGTPNAIVNELPAGSRVIPQHVRNQSVGRASIISSSVEGSVPLRARRSTLNGVKTAARSRSPSRARMRVRGFGMDAEVEIDDDDEVAGQPQSEASLNDQTSTDQMDNAEAAEDDTLTHSMATLTTEDQATVNARNRKFSTAASERPDLPPPSESGPSVGSRSCSSCSSATTGSISSSDFSLSSSQGSTSSMAASSPIAVRMRHRRKQRQAPADSASDYPPDTAISASASSPDQPRHNSARTAVEQDDEEYETYTESLIIEPSRASRRENQYIATMVEKKDPLTVKLFFRLLPYLNGKHTIDEIEYRIKMRRKDIRRLLTVFRQSILTFMHP